MSPDTPPQPGWRHRLDSPLSRLLALFLLLMVLMIPIGMIQGVVQERQARNDEAREDIESRWGGSQTVIGPVLRVPYVTRSHGPSSDGKTTVEYVKNDVAYFLPKKLSIAGKAATEARKRGIFEVPVYTARFKLEGEFAPLDFSGWDVLSQDIDWSRAELMMSISEPRALEPGSSASWNGQPVEWEPSTGQAGAWSPPGVHLTLGKRRLGEAGVAPMNFSIDLSFRGAGAIALAPAAEQTVARLQADWAHPNFQGSWLPAQRSGDAQGFDANWSISYLGRNYPQRWRDSSSAAEEVAKASFGVKLENPVDHYSLADRITKYASMTVVLTFAVLWLTELLSGRRPHVIQYGFVGAALCLFGLLQLSFAEHFGFNAAYLAAAGAVTLLVTLYSRSALDSTGRALMVGGVLGALYGYLYMILKAEDYALLGGSVALFVALAAAMYLTRKLDWSGAQAEPKPA